MRSRQGFLAPRVGRRFVTLVVASLCVGVAIAAKDSGEMDEHKYVNRLIEETSPYLLQHAHNPVDWYPWGAEALELAKQKDMPILLSIGVASRFFENP